jgi:hypothetical protein
MTTIEMLSRRALLEGAGTVGLAAAMSLSGVMAARADAPVGSVRFSGLSIDTQPLANRGLPDYAARIAREAQPVVASVFADRLAAKRTGAPRLILRIDSIVLNAMPNTGPFMTTGFDEISGAGVIVDAHGKVLQVVPVSTSAGAFGNTSSYIVSVEDLRTMGLVRVLAEWVKQSV